LAVVAGGAVAHALGTMGKTVKIALHERGSKE
jgi:hypothetical protein